jgi:endonuclease/exonuclease/phosphatase family metal-dependent hydrolase
MPRRTKKSHGAASKRSTKKPIRKPAKSGSRKTRKTTSPVRANRVRAVAAPAVARAVAPTLRLDVATFNTHGAVDRSGIVQANVAQYLQEQTPAIICFQELFFEDERFALDAELLGPGAFREVEGDIEIARNDGGIYSTRVGTTPTGFIGGAGAGIAIYTSLLLENARFIRFDGLQVPDSLSVKGILAVDVFTDDASFVIATTHFNDDENDRVDGRARGANIRTLSEFLADAADRPLIVMGDFNLDASARTGLDATLFRRLFQTAGRSWVEAGLENARQNGLARPAPTIVSGARSIDFMFASGVDGAMPLLVPESYLARDAFGSDHKLVRATLEFV